MKKTWILVAAVLVIAAVLLFSRMNGKNDTAPAEAAETMPAGEETPENGQDAEEAETEETEDAAEEAEAEEEAEEEVSGMEVQEETEIIIEEEGEGTIGF